MRARIAASIVLAAGLLLGTSGCAFFAPQSTLIEYDPSDGVGAIIGGVHIENALLLTQDGERASLLVNFINDGNKAVDMKVQYTNKNGKKTTTTYHVAAGGTKTYGAKGDKQIILTSIGTKAGALFPVYFQHGSGEGDQLMVPVLDGTWSTYKGLLPSPAATPTPTVTVSPAVPVNPAVTPPPVPSATPTPAG